VFKVVVTPHVWNDFFAIFDYIDKDNPTAANGFGAALLNQIELLAIFPHIGALVHQRQGVRKLLYTPIRIYYRIDSDARTVEILHFWHAARQEPDDFN
jgi:plasmid stabilization system protein ParE